MDSLRLLQTFVRVAEAGSFSAVARELHTTQSAISKQIQALESRLGAPLLVRSTRSHALTEAGQGFLERCRQILDTYEEARLEVRGAEHGLRGQLRIAAPVAFGRLHLVPRLQAFLAQHPGIRVDLQLDDRFIDLVGAGIDIAFRAGELKDSGLVARPLGLARRAALASSSYLERHGTPRHPRDLQQHNCLVYTGLATLNEWQFRGQDGKPLAIRVKGNFLSNSSEALREATCAGLGISFSPTWVYAEELRRGLVQPVLSDFQPAPLPLNAVFQPSRRPSLKIRAFVDFIAEQLQHAPDLDLLTVAA